MRNLVVYLRKMIFQYGFIVCVLFPFLLCLAGLVYEDFISANKYSIISALINIPKDEFLEHYELSAESIIINGTGSWIIMFVPIITTFSFIPLLCDEHESKTLRYEIVRSSKTNYFASQYIASLLAGSFALVLGYLLFCIFAMSLFPGISDYNQNLFSEYILNNGAYVAGKSIYELILIKLLNVWTYGLQWSMPGIFLTCIMKNKYLIMCLPFFGKYALGQFSLRLSDIAYSTPNNPNMTIYKISQILNPDSLLNINLYEKKMATLILFLSIAIGIVMFGFYLVVQCRRIDCGE